MHALLFQLYPNMDGTDQEYVAYNFDAVIADLLGDSVTANGFRSKAEKEIQKSGKYAPSANAYSLVQNYLDKYLPNKPC